MINEPDKWAQQTWIIPDGCRLVRDKDNWYIEVFMGWRIPIDTSYAEKLAESLITHHIKYAFDGEDPREQGE